MDKIVVIGGGGHAKVVIAMLHKLSGFEVVGYVDPNGDKPVLGVPHLGDDSKLSELRDQRNVSTAAIGVGHVHDCKARKSIHSMLLALDFQLPPIISPTAIINEGVTVGEGTVVMDGVILNPGTMVGPACIVNSGAIIEHDCQIGAFTHIAPRAVLCGDVTVGNATLIGAGSIVLPGITIADNCIIAAGATVVRDCMVGGCYAGIPAQVMP